MGTGCRDKSSLSLSEKAKERRYRGYTSWSNILILKKNMNESKPSEHPPLGGKLLPKGLDGDIQFGCRYENSSY